MFEGTLVGNITGVLYFCIFILAGIFILNRILVQERQLVRLWAGTVAGCVLLMWLPALVSFVLGFNILSHAIALALLAVLCVIIFLKTAQNPAPLFVFKWSGDIPLITALFIPVMFYFALTLFNHTLLPNENDGFTTGQCTFGDMNLHLSFITTPVAQGTFPPHYNILPSASLSYPFLGDTISSSIYLFGASLRIAYMLPMLAAAATVFLGGYLFFFSWLKSKAKAALAWVLFFLNGGFGFIYFLDNLRTDPDNFTRIFTAYYETPTNLYDKTVRWVNGIVDMMIPQRATLFGWMMLFLCLFLLYKAIHEKKKSYFLLAGIFTGLTPLINTHVFLSLGIICAVWLLGSMMADNRDTSSESDRKQRAIFQYLMYALAFGSFLVLLFAGYKADWDYLAGITIFVFPVLLGYGIYQLALQIKKGRLPELLGTWGFFLLAVLLLAAPQLFCFTFKQAASGSFMQPHFNWVNENDNYIWFYIKNIGLPLLLLVPAILAADKKQRLMVAPAALLLLLADTIALQPNTYDNNKLLYPAFVLVAGVVAAYMVDLYGLLKHIKGAKVIATIAIVLCVFSATLTIGREIVSAQYELYDEAQLEAATYIQENAPGDATVLTNDRHNNAISSLTGRDIVCGSNTFLYFHGHNTEYQTRQADIRLMYSSPEEYLSLFEKYEVDYIMVSSPEQASYQIDEDGLAQLFTLVYNQDDVKFYAVTARAGNTKE